MRPFRDVSLLPAIIAIGAALAVAGLPSTPGPAAAGNATPPLPDSAVVARLGRELITAGELRYAYRNAEGVDMTVPEAELKRDLLDRLISRKLLAAEARRRGLDRATSLERFATRTRRALAGQELRNRIYGGQIEVSEAEMRELYERYFYTFRARHLSLDQPDRAAELHAKLLAGADFEDLARRYSEDRGTARAGGDMGDRTAGYLLIDFEDAVFGLEPGGITPVIKGKGEHYKIFKLESMVKDQSPQPFEALREHLEARVRLRKAGAMRYAWETGLLERHAYGLHPEGYQRFADRLRDNIAEWEAIYALRPDSLPEAWIFANWTPAENAMAIATYAEGAVTVADFNKRAREMRVCPTCLWRDSDVQLTQHLKGIVFDRLVEAEIDTIVAEDLEWIQEELDRRVEDRLVNMLTLLVRTQPEEITDDEVREHLDANPGRYMKPPRARARRLVVASEDQAWDLWNRIEGGADLAALAERFSIDERSNFRGGDTDYFIPGQLEGMDAVAFEHEPGDLVPPFETANGWEIIHVLEKIPTRPMTLDEARESVQKQLALDRTHETVLHLAARLRQRTPLRIYEDRLSALTLAAADDGRS